VSNNFVGLCPKLVLHSIKHTQSEVELRVTRNQTSYKEKSNSWK
jgi:hypothetical protein